MRGRLTGACEPGLDSDTSGSCSSATSALFLTPWGGVTGLTFFSPLKRRGGFPLTAVSSLVSELLFRSQEARCSDRQGWVGSVEYPLSLPREAIGNALPRLTINHFLSEIKLLCKRSKTEKTEAGASLGIASWGGFLCRERRMEFLYLRNSEELFTSSCLLLNIAVY